MKKWSDGERTALAPPPPPVQPTWFARHRTAVTLSLLAFGLAWIAFAIVYIMPAIQRQKAPTNTQARVTEASRKVEFVDRCVNGKQALIVKVQHDMLYAGAVRSDTYMLWNVDMAGRPIQCSEPNEVGMK